MNIEVKLRNENGSKLIPLPAFLWKLLGADVKKISYEACKDKQGVYLKLRVKE